MMVAMGCKVSAKPGCRLMARSKVVNVVEQDSVRGQVETAA